MVVAEAVGGGGHEAGPGRRGGGDCAAAAMAGSIAEDGDGTARSWSGDQCRNRRIFFNI